MADPPNSADLSPPLEAGERETAVPELLHLFANHLQVLGSLISLQASALTDSEQVELLRTVHNRLRAIAEVHAQLGKARNLAAVHVGECLRILARNLAADFDLGPGVKLRTSLADLALDVDGALPLALLANEFLSNAFKHAFPNGGAGSIALELRYTSRLGEDRDWCELTVTDDGVGCPDSVQFLTADTTGFRVCRGLVKQIAGSIHFESGNGTRVHVSFPLASE